MSHERNLLAEQCVRELEKAAWGIGRYLLAQRHARQRVWQSMWIRHI
jgi:hypothetical protein